MTYEPTLKWKRFTSNQITYRGGNVDFAVLEVRNRGNSRYVYEACVDIHPDILAQHGIAKWASGRVTSSTLYEHFDAAIKLLETEPESILEERIAIIRKKSLIPERHIAMLTHVAALLRMGFI